MVGGDTPQQGIGMQPITNGFWIGGGVGLQPGCNPGLLFRGHQALHPQIAHRLVAAAAAENEIDRWEHRALRHLGHHKADRRCLRLGRLRRTPLAFVTFGSPPHLAVGMQTSACLIQQGMQTLGTAETELQGNRPEITEHQPRGPMHPLNPIRQLTSVGHRGRQRHQLHRRRAVND